MRVRLVAAALACAAPASAAVFDASQPDRLVGAMQAFGYEAALTQEPDGSPRIEGRLPQGPYAVRFYGCGRGVCDSIQFVAILPARGATAERTNTHNLTWRYGRITAEPGGSVVVRYDVNLDGGVTVENLEDTLAIWRELFAEAAAAFPPR